MCKFRLFHLTVLLYLSYFVSATYYIDDIKSIINFDVQPCTDFKNHACGHINTDVIQHKDKYSLENKFVELYNQKEKHSISEEKAALYFESCKDKHNARKAFEQIQSLKNIVEWPTAKKITEDILFQLMVDLSILNSSPLLEIRYFGKKEYMERPRVNSTILVFNGISYRNIKKELTTIRENMKKLNFADESKIENELKNIEKLMDNLKNIDDDGAADNTEMIGNLKELETKIPNFNWSKFLKMYCDLLELDYQHVTSSFMTFNLKKLIKMVDFIQNSDKKTLVNFLVQPYMDVLDDFFVCEKMLMHFKPLMIATILKDYFNKEDKMNYLEILNNFNSSFSEKRKVWGNTRLRFSNPSDSMLYYLSNYESLLEKSTLKEFYDEFKIEKNQFFTNEYNIHLQFQKMLLNKLNKLYSFLEILQHTSDHSFDIESHKKPLIYYYTKVAYDMWLSWIQPNSNGFENLIKKNDDSCEKLDTTKIPALLAVKFSLEDYNKYFSVIENSKDIQIYKNIEFTADQVKNQIFFLNLMQSECTTGMNKEGNEIDFNKIFNMNSGFSKAFKCENKTNKNNCDIEITV